MNYTVKKGDGWYKIAKNMGVDLNELLQANNANLNTMIHPGQILKSPKSPEKQFVTYPTNIYSMTPQAQKLYEASGAPKRYAEELSIYAKKYPYATQKALNDAGYKVKVDGIWGRQSQAALEQALSDGAIVGQDGVLTFPKKQLVSKSVSQDSNKLTKTNIKDLQQQLKNAGYDLGKSGIDGIWGKMSQRALEQAMKDGYIYENGRLLKKQQRSSSIPYQYQTHPMFGTPIFVNPFMPQEYQAGAEEQAQSVPKNVINTSRKPNKVLSSKPAIINGEKIDACAKYGNCVLTDQGYISNGHAWTRHNNQRTIYSGYNVASRPKTYDVDSVVKYNSEAADNVVRDFDFNTLDKNSAYTVGMYYKGSPSQEIAYNEGIDGVANTHTGNLFWNPETNSWVVEHDISGTTITNELMDVLGSRGKYGVTGIYKPHKANTLGHIISFIRGLNK